MNSVRKSLYDIVPPVIDIPAEDQNLLNVLREHNIATYQHSVNVALLMYEFANYTMPDSLYKSTYYLTGLFHDIGKLCISNEMLDYDGPLSEHDRNIINLHAEYGARLVVNFDDEIVEAIRDHHKFFENIDHVNILTMALHTLDVYDALCQPRPYCPAIDRHIVLEFMKEYVGTEFSPYTFDVLEHHLIDFSYKKFTMRR